MDYKRNFIEIPFGARDSETLGWEYTIPDDMEAKIENGKIIVRKKESEDEKVPKLLYKLLCGEVTAGQFEKYGLTVDSALFWLEKQKPVEWSKEDETAFQDALWCCKQAASIAKDENDMGNAWYAERWLKSLKERVQPQSKYEWKQENTDALTDFENLMMHIGISFFGQHAGLDPNDTNAIKEQANILLGLVPKQEWSKKDKEHLDDVIYTVLVSCPEGCERDELVEWLKSIKERCIPQQNQEWSKEDEECYVSIMEHLKESITNGKPETYTTGCLTDWIENRVRNIRPQSKQEWSEEDENYYSKLTKFLEINSHYEGNPKNERNLKEILLWLKSFKQEWSEEDNARIERIASFVWKNRKGDTSEIYQQEQDIKWLKSLKPQNHWKPSDEQMRSLSNAINVLHDLHENTDSGFLVSLYNDLKKLKEE